MIYEGNRDMLRLFVNLLSAIIFVITSCQTKAPAADWPTWVAHWHTFKAWETLRSNSVMA